MLANSRGKQFWNRLIGADDGFGLEGQIFHSVCIIALVGIVLNIPFNYLIGLPDLGVVMSAIGIVVGLIFYLSRFKKRLKAAVIFFQVFNLLLLAGLYYFNSGITGPSYIVFLVSLVITVVTVPRGQYRVWLPLNVLLMGGLFLLERIFPDLIRPSYTGADNKFIDFIYSYLICGALVVFMLVFIRNGYHREKARAEMEAVKLKASNQTKNKLLSILAHDLKEPLSSIQGFLELLGEYRIEQRDRENIERELLTRTQNVSQLLANVLSWTRTQMEGTEVHLSRIALWPALANTIEIYGRIALQKGVGLDHRLPGHLCVVGDQDMLQLVARNLLMNAIKFSPPGGEVLFTAESDGASCTMAIKDNGIGIPIEKQDQLFSLAGTVSYGTANEKGAGLGLVMCKHFIELQGGKIWFESGMGSGTTFFVSLPCCSKDSPGSPADRLDGVEMNSV